MRVLLPKLAFGDQYAQEYSGQSDALRSLWHTDSFASLIDFVDVNDGAVRIATASLGGTRLVSFSATAHREVVEYQTGALLVLPVAGKFRLAWRDKHLDLLGRKAGVFLQDGGWQVEAGLCSAIKIGIRPELLEPLGSYVATATGGGSLSDIASSPHLLQINPDMWDNLIAYLGVAYLLAKNSHSSVLQLEDFTLRFIAMLFAASLQGGISEASASITRVEEDRLQLIIDAVRADLSTPLSLGDMEIISGMSRRSIQYMFKERFGLSPIGWQLRERLSAAYAALSDATDQRTITQIAFDYGFASSSTFSLYFRRQFGLPPSKLR